LQNPEFWLRLTELGPVRALPAIFLALLVLRLCYCWRYRGARDIRQFGGGWTWVILITAGVVLPCYYVCRDRYWGLPAPFERGEIGILIGEVPGDTNQQQQAAYAREIRALVQKTPELEAIVKVEMLERPLPADPQEQHAKALQWGRWLRATLVLRPNVVEGVQEPWITVVDQPDFSMAEAPMGKFPSAQLANLDQLPLPSDLLLLARCALAVAFYRRGSYEHVAGDLQEILATPGLLELAPSRSSLSFIFGNALSFLGRTEEAIAEYRQALRLKPYFPEAHYNLGNALSNTRDLDGAIAEYREALRLKPEFFGAHNNLGNALRDKHDLDGAIAEYRQALRLNPDNAQARINLQHHSNSKPKPQKAPARSTMAHTLNPDKSSRYPRSKGSAPMRRGGFWFQVVAFSCGGQSTPWGKKQADASRAAPHRPVQGVAAIGCGPG
jgi:tetratricopeptide (TPR) repeat protein